MPALHSITLIHYIYLPFFPYSFSMKFDHIFLSHRAQFHSTATYLKRFRQDKLLELWLSNIWSCQNSYRSTFISKFDYSAHTHTQPNTLQNQLKPSCMHTQDIVKVCRLSWWTVSISFYWALYCIWLYDILCYSLFTMEWVKMRTKNGWMHWIFIFMLLTFVCET